MKSKHRNAGLLVFSFFLALAWILCPTPLLAQDVVVSQASPDNAPQGTVNLNVQVKGKGFKKGAVATWLVTGSETDTGGVTVNSTTFLSTTDLIANITVASEAQTQKKFDIKVTLSGGRTGKGIELFKVIYNPPDPAIAYTVGGELWVMNADGSNRIMLLDDQFQSVKKNHYEPNWSPDGSQLVFSSDIAGYGIYIINRDGSGLRKVVATNGASLADPVWSPVPLADGNYKIAFSDDIGEHDLFLVNLDGSGLVNITQTPGFAEFYPTWSPTGDRLAAQRWISTGEYNDLVVYTLGADGAIVGQANLTDVPGSPLNDAEIYECDWAKTQDKIAFKAQWDIWVIDLADPANPVRLTQTSAVNEFAASWSADDSKIIYRRNAARNSKEKAGMFVMNADGSGATGDPYPAGGSKPDWRRCCPTCATVCAP